MKKEYAVQVIEWAEQAKEILTIRKEIILDKMSDEELGKWVRCMYKAKVEEQNNIIERTKENIK
jgi:aromatic ring-cleaving dioxygenase